VVIDHDTGVLLWAHPGRDEKTLGEFTGFPFVVRSFVWVRLPWRDSRPGDLHSIRTARAL